MFSLDIKGGIPIYEQLYHRIAELISNEVLGPDEKLPTVREVAKELGINPNTVQKTYQKLEQDRLIYSIPAKGSYVAKKEDAVTSLKAKAMSNFIDASKSAMRLGIGRELLAAELEKIAI